MNSKKHLTIAILSLILPIIVILRTAWVSDDAYITFRVVENFVAGNGLVWNFGERTWVYTHPLWMLVISTFKIFISDIYLLNIVLSIVITIAVIVLIQKESKNVYLAVLVPVIYVFSKCLVDYSTSGLENPLSHLLVILAFISASKNKHFYTLFFSFLLIFNRYDLLLLISPLIAITSYKLTKSIGWSNALKLLLLSASPFIVWELFAFLYYGFPIPNTAIAKLNTGIDGELIYSQGLSYTLDFIKNDSYSFILILIAALFAIKSKQDWTIAAALGIIFYFLYIVSVGGDFMSGRFYSVLTAISLFLIVRLILEMNYGVFQLFILTALLTPLAMLNLDKTLFSDHSFASNTIPASGIADERAYYFQSTGLIRQEGVNKGISHEWAYNGLEHTRNKQSINLICSIGFYGYHAPRVKIIEPFALSNRFLSRFPARKTWRVGHYERYIPIPYLKTYTTENLEHFKDALTIKEIEYLALLKNIDTLPLFSVERLKTIYKLNFNNYNFNISNRNYIQLSSIKSEQLCL